MPRLVRPLAMSLLASMIAWGSLARTAEPKADDAEFYEKEVLPVLQAHCLNCHGGQAKIKGALRLTSRADVLKGGDTGPAVNLDKPAESLLLKAINHTDDDLKMPPKGKLSAAQIDVLTRWVTRGLPMTASKAAVHSGPPKVDAEARNFWAFRPVTRPAAPRGAEPTVEARNPIDGFVGAKRQAAGLSAAPPADKVTLLRRVYYAVTGLPPSLADVDAFVADTSPDAYERVVDRLLNSRHYGEHWGRHWLDLVRYADTNSFERDTAKPFAWKYRDYVISSLNADKPYDRFIREQIAGDEMNPVTRESIIATGYYRLGLWDDEPVDADVAYYDGLDDIISTTGQTFLGLTVGCARCHDHKIDPFPQADYYRLLAFVHGVRAYGERSAKSVMEASVGPVAVSPGFTEAAAEHQKKIDEAEGRLRVIEQAIREKLVAGERDDFEHESSRLPIIRKLVHDALISREVYNAYVSARNERLALIRNAPTAMEQALVVKEAGPKPRDTFVFVRGNAHAQGTKVEPGFPSVLTDAAPWPPKALDKSSGRRTVLADWIADPSNPLTARVMVNRVWQYHFGRGIVRSSSNFGYQGSPPTHPELLDWLASEFVASGWSLKHLHRLILTSSTFRMSGRFDPVAATKDPENDLLWRFDPRRLSAEEVRDSILAVSGNLNLKKVDGPAVYPPIPKEVHAGQSRPGDGWPTSGPEDAAARSVFVSIKRSLAVPLLAAFDAPDPDATCPVRFTTTQPTQALGMINSEFVNRQAGLFAESIAKDAGGDVAAQVRLALRRATQRMPTPSEVERGVRFVAALRAEDQLSADEALRRFCLLALNLNEFVYVD
jgi:mono/diheme cytochrome c family protein